MVASLAAPQRARIEIDIRAEGSRARVFRKSEGDCHAAAGANFQIATREGGTEYYS